MSKKRPYGFDSRPIGAKCLYENCDGIISHIQDFYAKYERVISLSDKKQLLIMLVRIQKCDKRIPCSERTDMYKTVNTMLERYNSR